MLNKLAPRSKQIVIEAEDDTRGQARQTSISNMPKNVTATGGLPTTLILAEGTKVMLTVNVDVSDGLVNGARGIINPRRACAARVTVVVLSFCLSVCLSVCLLPRFLPLRATRRPISDSNGFSATLALF